MKLLQRLYFWFLCSSADPKKISATIKYGLSFVALFFGWAEVGPELTQDIQNDLARDATNALMLVAQIGTAVGAFYGFLRKIANTIRSLA